MVFSGTNKNPPFKSKLTTHREEPALQILFCFFYGTFFGTLWELIRNTNSSTPHWKSSLLYRLVLALVDTFGTFWYFFGTFWEPIKSWILTVVLLVRERPALQVLEAVPSLLSHCAAQTASCRVTSVRARTTVAFCKRIISVTMER